MAGLCAAKGSLLSACFFGPAAPLRPSRLATRHPATHPIVEPERAVDEEASGDPAVERIRKPASRICLTSAAGKLMDQADLDLRNATYGQARMLGRAPSAVEVARATGLDSDRVRAGWLRLHDEHALVLDQARAELRMLNPFSAVASTYRVRAGNQLWYANCAWDAFGILGALDADGRVDTSCPDCGEAIEVEVRDGRPDDTSLLFHCLVPARRWWNDIVFT